MNELIPPATRLRPMVEGYWVRQEVYRPAKKVRVIADACTKLIFEFAPTPWPSCYLLGTQLSPIVVDLDGTVNRVGIRFRAGMAGLLLGASLDGLDKTSLEDSVLRFPQTGEVHKRLSRLYTTSDRIRYIDDWLLGCLERRRQALPIMRETRRVRRILARGGAPQQVASALNMSERRVQHLCRERFGATAVSLHRCYRFQALARRLKKPGGSLADLAVETGFSDQAHMAREFRQFAGVSITSYLRERSGNLQDGANWLPVLRDVGGDTP